MSGRKYYRPQLELCTTSDETPTPWVPGPQEFSSEIKQTANEIHLTVNGELRQTGITINGDQSKIDLIAGKVNFVDPNGNAYAEPKISIDPTTGILKATDAELSGKVAAKSGSIGGFTINQTQIKDENENIVLNSDGTATLRGKIEGSLRNPVYRIDVSPTGYTKDNIALVQVSGGTTSFPSSVNLTVDGTKSGGKLTRLIAGKWGTTTSNGTTTVTIKDTNDNTKVY